MRNFFREGLAEDASSLVLAEFTFSIRANLSSSSSRAIRGGGGGEEYHVGFLDGLHAGQGVGLLLKYLGILAE